MTKYGRTDMAAEAFARLDSTRLPEGITAHTERLFGFDIFHVYIVSDSAGNLIHKRAGDYYTVKLNLLPKSFDLDFENTAKAISALIYRSLPDNSRSFLIAALGNPDITPDALGSLCAEYIPATRHLSDNESFKSLNSVAVLRTGVLGTTGMESAFQLKAVCNLIKPDTVIVVDALAGADLSGLCRSIQISTGGISPGSGVLNNRPEISSDFLGVPVISVGVPTVADGKDLIDDASGDTFLTARNIDVAVRSLGRVIGYGINMAVHPGLTVNDVRELTE